MTQGEGAGVSSLSTLFQRNQDEVLLCNPGRRFLRAVLDTVWELHPLDLGLGVLASEQTAAAVFDAYRYQSRASQLDTDGVLRLRTAELSAGPALVSDEAVYAYVDDQQCVGGNAPDLADTLGDRFDTRWGGGDQWYFTTPGLETVTAELDEWFHTTLATSFRDVALQSAVDDLPHGEVSLLVVLGARHDCSNHQLTRVADWLRFASRGTISKAKTHLEEQGVIHASTFTPNSGMPRQRLHLSDAYQDLSVDALLETVTETAG